MPTDDERRRVATALRATSRRYASELWSKHNALHAYDEVRRVLYGSHGAPKSLCELFDRLADLIEPTCDATATHTDASATCGVSQSRRSGVDREELLELADEMDETVRRGKVSEGWTAGVTLLISRFTNRIREACGATDSGLPTGVAAGGRRRA